MRQKTLALYIRLSKEDDDVGISSEKEESNSITNQRMLLYDYLKSHPEFQDYRIIEKCDDGYLSLIHICAASLSVESSFRIEGFFSCVSFFAENSLKAAVSTSASRPLKNTR